MTLQYSSSCFRGETYWNHFLVITVGLIWLVWLLTKQVQNHIPSSLPRSSKHKNTKIPQCQQCPHLHYFCYKNEDHDRGLIKPYWGAANLGFDMLKSKGMEYENFMEQYWSLTKHFISLILENFSHAISSFFFINAPSVAYYTEFARE